jgi:hypothetical protein
MAVHPESVNRNTLKNGTQYQDLEAEHFDRRPVEIKPGGSSLNSPKAELIPIARAA